MAHIVDNADRKVVLGFGIAQFSKDTLHHSGCKFFGREAVASADDFGHLDKRGFTIHHTFTNGSHHILVERFAGAARLFGAVEDGNRLDRGRQGGDKQFTGKGTIEADFEQTNFFALFAQIAHRLFHRFSAGPHENNHPLSIGCANIIKEMVVATGQQGEFVHHFLDNGRRGGVVGVDRFAALEINIGVLRRAAHDGMVG